MAPRGLRRAPEHRAGMPSRRSTRARGLLSLGLLLGLGSTLTLAAWTDVERTNATFSTTLFDTEVSVDGSLYQHTPAAPGAAIAFNGAGMSPATQRYGLVLVRTTTGSTAGTIELSGATFTPPGTAEATVLGAALRYRVVLTSGPCDASAFSGTPVWVVGGASTAAPLATGQNAMTITLPAATADAPGSPVGLCFEVQLPAGAAPTLQNTTTTAVWSLTASSV